MLFQPATLNKHFAEASSIAYLRAYQILYAVSVNPQTNPFCFFLSRLNGTTFEPRTLKNNWEQFWTPRDSGSMGKHFWKKKFVSRKKYFSPILSCLPGLAAHFGVQQKKWFFNTINGSCSVGATYEQRNTITDDSSPKSQRCVLGCKFLHYLWLRKEHGCVNNFF